MSQQPRRRRRRRRGRGGSGEPGRPQGDAPVSGQQEASTRASQASGGRTRGGGRRRGKRRGTGSETAASPKSSEDLVRAATKAPPERLTLPPDERRLDQIIGDLQSEWGVPQSPQEYRITLKVAEDRPRGGRNSDGDAKNVEEVEPTLDERPLREKAPAAPRMGTETQTSPREAAPAHKKRSRRRRRKRKGRASN